MTLRRVIWTQVLIRVWGISIPRGKLKFRRNWLMYYLNFPPKTGSIAGCSDPLGLSTNQISDDSFFATSWQPGRSGPWYGRLNNESRRSWCSTVSDDNQYIQVNKNIAFLSSTIAILFGTFVWSVWVWQFNLKLKTAFNIANVGTTLPDYSGVSQLQTKSSAFRWISRRLKMKEYNTV